MPKQFIVRLRKGSPTGNIVASSQIITVNGLGADSINASNFTDNVMSGRVGTVNRNGSFTRTLVIPKWTVAPVDNTVRAGVPFDFTWTSSIANITPEVKWYPVYPDTTVPYNGLGLELLPGELNTLATPNFTGTFLVATKNVASTQQFQMTLWTGGLGTSTLLARSIICYILPAVLEVDGPASALICNQPSTEPDRPVPLTVTGYPGETVSYSSTSGPSSLTGSLTLDSNGRGTINLATSGNLLHGVYKLRFGGNKSENTPDYSITVLEEPCCEQTPTPTVTPTPTATPTPTPTGTVVPTPTPTATPTPTPTPTVCVLKASGPQTANKNQGFDVTITGCPNEEVTITYKKPTIDHLYFDYNPDVAAAYNTNNYGLTKDQFSQTHWDSYGAKEGRLSPASLKTAFDTQNQDAPFKITLDSTGSFTNKVNSNGELLPRQTPYCWTARGNISANTVEYCVTVADPSWSNAAPFPTPTPTPTPTPSASQACPQVTEIKELTNRDLQFKLDIPGVATVVEARISEGTTHNASKETTIYKYPGDPLTNGQTGVVDMQDYLRTGKNYVVRFYVYGPNGCRTNTTGTSKPPDYKFISAAAAALTVPSTIAVSGLTSKMVSGKLVETRYPVYVTFASDGDIEYGWQNVEEFASSLRDTWTTPLTSGIGNDYEIKAVNTQTPPAGGVSGPLGSWVSLASDVTWSMAKPSSTKVYQRATLKVELRKKGTTIVLKTVTVYFNN